VVDEYTRVPLLTYVARTINSRDLIREVSKLFAAHGVPRAIRSDNGPELMASRLRSHLESHGVATLYVEPGSPWQNGIVESFNGRLRDECLNIEAFHSLREAVPSPQRAGRAIMGAKGASNGSQERRVRA
jgi:transposase InsO family protein